MYTYNNRCQLTNNNNKKQNRLVFSFLCSLLTNSNRTYAITIQIEAALLHLHVGILRLHAVGRPIQEREVIITSSYLSKPDH